MVYIFWHAGHIMQIDNRKQLNNKIMQTAALEHYQGLHFYLQIFSQTVELG